MSSCGDVASFGASHQGGAAWLEIRSCRSALPSDAGASQLLDLALSRTVRTLRSAEFGLQPADIVGASHRDRPGKRVDSRLMLVGENRQLLLDDRAGIDRFGHAASFAHASISSDPRREPYDDRAMSLAILASTRSGSTTTPLIVSAALVAVGGFILVFRRQVFAAVGEIFRGRASYDLETPAGRRTLIVSYTIIPMILVLGGLLGLGTALAR